VQHRRHYTVEEANALRRWVASRVERLRSAQALLLESEACADVAAAAMVTGGGWPGSDHAGALLEWSLGMEDLDRLEIVVRDLDRGLVDFPSLREGEEVYLCWLVDEPEVGHWHGLQAGFAGRRPL
jgi:hypothetical protein